MSSNGKFLTENGLKKLGVIINKAREANNLSLRDMAQIISQKLPNNCPIESVDTGTLSRIEKGHGEPRHNTLAAIAFSQLIKDETGKILDIFDFISIASES